MIFSKIHTSNVVERLIRYVAEIVIIFVGITFSFLFDQWRDDVKKKKDLVELSKSLVNDVDGLKKRLRDDLRGSTEWIGH